MMETIRTAANHISVKIIFTLIILSFIFAGVSGMFSAGGPSDDSEYIAKVNGEGLSRAAFEAQAQEAIKNSGSIDNYFEQYMRRGILDELINNYLAYNLSNELKVRVSDDIVKDAIRQQTVFFENGKFSNKLFRELLAMNGYTPESYANAIRTQMEQQQTGIALIESDFVLPVDSNISLLKSQLRTVYTSPLSNRFVDTSNMTFSDDELLDYYEKNINTNTITYQQDILKLNMLRLPRVFIEMQTKVSDEEIKDFYDNNASNYKTPVQYSFSAIEVETKEKADELYEQLQAGHDFASLAEVNAIYPSQRKAKGYLGWLEESQLPESIKQTNLTTNGQISLPIKQENGNYLIVKLNDKKESLLFPFDMVSAKIKNELIQSKTDIQFSEAVSKLEQLVEEGKSIEDIGEEMGLEPSITSWLSQALSPFRYPSIQDAIYNHGMIENNLSTGRIVGPIFADEADAYYVFSVADFRPAGQQPFEVVKDDIVDKLKNIKSRELFKDEAEILVQKLNISDKDAFNNVQFANRATLSRDSAELEPTVVNDIFSVIPTIDGKAIHGISYKNDREATVFALIKVDTPTEIQDISAELKPEFIKNTQYYLLKDLRADAKIEIMPNANL